MEESVTTAFEEEIQWWYTRRFTESFLYNTAEKCPRNTMKGYKYWYQVDVAENGWMEITQVACWLNIVKRKRMNSLNAVLVDRRVTVAHTALAVYGDEEHISGGVAQNKIATTHSSFRFPPVDHEYFVVVSAVCDG